MYRSTTGLEFPNAILRLMERFSCLLLVAKIPILLKLTLVIGYATNAAMVAAVIAAKAIRAGQIRVRSQF